jgi:hypothetical protein
LSSRSGAVTSPAKYDSCVPLKTGVTCLSGTSIQQKQMRAIVLVALLAIIAVVFAQTTTAAPKKSSVIGKLLKKKVSEKTENAEKKKIKSIFTRLIQKAQNETAITKLPIKDQVKIANGKLTQRVKILKNILRKITVGSKKDDAEKKTLKSILREFAAKDLLRASVQQKLLNKATKPNKGSKRPKPSKKATKKDAVKKALADAEFLGKFGKFLGSALKTVGKAALQGAKDGAIGALTGAIA